jgi:Domain of unknown function (DUF4349)
MTTIDESFLEAELVALAGGLEPSPDHREILLELADAPGGRLSVITRPGRVRTRLVGSAAAAVLVAGTALVTWGTSVGPSMSTAQMAARARRSAPLPPRSAGDGVSGSGFASGALAPLGLTVTAGPGQTKAYSPTSATSTSVQGAHGSAATGSATIGPKIESTGTVGLRVGASSVGSTLTRLAALATADDGSVASLLESASSRPGGRISSGVIVLSVPQGRFAALVRQVQRLGTTRSVRTSSTDVTSQYVDLSARVAALEVSRRQYLAIMAKATTISGILAVQSQVDSLQSQIEQLQGQLNVLDHETAFGRLAVTVSAPAPAAPAPHHRSGVARAWDASVGGFVRAVEGLIRVSGPALFVLLCLGVLGLVGRGAWRYAVRRRL